MRHMLVDEAGEARIGGKALDRDERFGVVMAVAPQRQIGAFGMNRRKHAPMQRADGHIRVESLRQRGDHAAANGVGGERHGGDHRQYRYDHERDQADQRRNPQPASLCHVSERPHCADRRTSGTRPRRAATLVRCAGRSSDTSGRKPAAPRARL